MISIVINVLLAIHVLVCVLLVFVVLLQRPRNEGLGAAFGGGMTENMFGAQTSNVLAKFTVWLGGGFFALTLVLSMLYAMRSNANSDSGLIQELEQTPVPAAEGSQLPEAAAPVVETTVVEEAVVTEPAPAENSEANPTDSPAAPTSAPTEAPTAEATPAP